VNAKRVWEVAEERRIDLNSLCHDHRYLLPTSRVE
jgi:hypothetical protein